MLIRSLAVVYRLNLKNLVGGKKRILLGKRKHCYMRWTKENYLKM